MDISKLTLEQKIMQTEIALMEKGKKLKYVPGAVFFFGQIITEAATLQTAFSAGKDKTVGVSFGSPYLFKQYFPRANTFVNAYSMLDCQVEAFVKAFFGEEKFGTESPVNL